MVASGAALVAGPAGALHPVGGLWPMDEGRGQVVWDLSGRRNHGVLGASSATESSDPRWIATGLLSRALRFDGGDFVTVDDAPSLESKRITVVAEVRASGTPGAYRYVVSKGAFMCESASYGLFTGSGGGLRFYVSTTSEFVLSPDAGPSVWDGRWHRVIGTYDGTSVRLYVDGGEVGTGTPSSLVPEYGRPDGDDFFIGDYGGPCGSQTLGFIGDIDSVTLLNEVYTP